MRKIKRLLRPVYKFAIAFRDDLNRRYIHQVFPAKPIGINMNANDICNSKCVMCNIWQQKKDFEMSPADLELLLKDKLFSKIRYIGITGGEPTLREDLPELYLACIKALPSLTHLSIITNAIKEKDVIARIEKVAAICKEHNKAFSIMVSLDGVGEMHDKIRGRKGNFESAIQVLEYFENHSGIPVEFGATISKDNLWEIDDLLYYTKKRGWTGRFRIAEFIVRLYNLDKKNVIRNFDEEETFHLQCFYQKLAEENANDFTARRNYLSNISLLSGGKRLMACPHHNLAVQLDSRGRVHYCAPKSKTLGSAIKESGWKLWKKNLGERKRLLKEECDNCIHDYRAPVTTNELLQNYRDFLVGGLFCNIQFTRYLKPVYYWAKLKSSGIKKTQKLIYITGWYGTETVGDKAILGGIFNHYISLYGKDNVSFAVSSLYPFVTVKTLKELQQPAEIVPVNSIRFASYAIAADEVVMGGGPLMDLEILSLPLWSFQLAKLAGKRTVVFGCGLGPLRNERYQQAVKKILRIADQIWLRDQTSCNLAAQWTGRTDIQNTGCPARNYVISRQPFIPAKASSERVLACFLRKWPAEYKENITKEQFDEYRNNFEMGLANYIKELCALHNLTPHFYPMHTFHIGDDDRDFYREFTDKYFQDVPYYLHKQNSNVDFVIERMKSSEMNLCMRFHSVLFASTLNTNFKAIDYTRGGKIEAFLKDNNQIDKLITMDELIKSLPLTEL